MMTGITHNTFTESHCAFSSHSAEVEPINVKTIFDAWDKVKDSASAVTFLAYLKQDYQNPLAPVSRKLFFLARIKRDFIAADEVAAHSAELLQNYLANLKDCIEAIKTSILPADRDRKEQAINCRNIAELLKLPMNVHWSDENLAFYLEIINSLHTLNISHKKMAELLDLPQNINWSLENLKSYLKLIASVSKHVENLLSLLKISAKEWDSTSFQAYLKLVQIFESSHHVKADAALELLIAKKGFPWAMGDCLAYSGNGKNLELYTKYIFTLINKGIADETILALISSKTKMGNSLGHLLAESKNDALINQYLALLTSLVKKGQANDVLAALQAINNEGETVLHVLAKHSIKSAWALLDALTSRFTKIGKVFNLIQLQDKKGYTVGHQLAHRVDMSRYLEFLAKFKEHENFLGLLNASNKHGTTLLHQVAACHSASLLNQYWKIIDRFSDSQGLDLIERKDRKGMTIGDILIAQHHHDEALSNYLSKLRIIAGAGNEVIKKRVKQITEQEFEKNIAILSSEPKNLARYQSVLGDFLGKLAAGEWKATFVKLCNIASLELVDRNKTSLETFLNLRKKLHSHTVNANYQASTEFNRICFKKPWFGVKAAVKAVWKEIDAKFLTDAIRMGTFDKKEYAYFVFCKENLKEYILNIKNADLKAKLITECLEEESALGQYFHTSRGWLKPSIKRGILGELHAESVKLGLPRTISSPSSVSSSYSSVIALTESSSSMASIEIEAGNSDLDTNCSNSEDDIEEEILVKPTHSQIDFTQSVFMLK